MKPSHFLSPVSVGLLALVAPPAAAQCETGFLFSTTSKFGDLFGRAVAFDGDTVAVGATGFDVFATPATSVHIFERAGSTWTETTVFDSTNGTFGADVALEGDTLFVGSPGSGFGGQVFVYERSGTTWTEVQQLTVSSGGSPIALDGDTAVIGALGDNLLGQNAGAVHVFERQNGTWTSVQVLRASDGEGDDVFGSGIDVSGGTIVVGANGEATAGLRAGAAYIFEETVVGWVETAKVIASDAETFDGFGSTVAVSENDVFVSAPSADLPGMFGVGAVYHFEQSVFGWGETQMLLASDPAQAADFGFALDVEGDLALVGAKDAAPSGAVYVLERTGSGWAERVKLGATSASPGADLGFSVALSGAEVVAGAPDANGVTNLTGAAFVFDLGSLPETYCTAAPNSAGAGARISVSGTVSVTFNDLRLVATGAPPDQFGVFFYGPEATETPFGEGFLCVGAGATGTFRLNPSVLADASGTATRLVDFTEPPASAGAGAIQAGASWYFQFWYRDPLAGGSFFNLSDGVRVVFCP